MQRLTLLALLFAPFSVLAADWPQWRGPAGDGLAPTAGMLPSEWGPETNIIWKAKLPGAGAATPCLVGDAIYLTAQAGDDLLLVCLGTDGQERFTRKLATGESKFRGDEANLASASCVSDGKLVFSFVGTGHLSAHTLTGEPVWAVDCQERYGAFKTQFGIHWTPALHAGRLYLQLFHRNAQKIACMDAATGREVWGVDRPSDSQPGSESPDVYASAGIWQKGDKAYLVCHGNDYCTAHDLTDGRELWRVGELNPKENYNRTWRAVASPLLTPDLIVVPSCKNGVVVGVDPEKASGLVLPGTPGEKWRMPRGTPDVPSPLLANDVLYLVGERGTLTTVNPATGEVLDTQTLTNERHRANPVFADGKLIVVGREGTMPVVAPGQPPEVLATNKLPDTFTASPAVVGDRIYLRGWDYLWVVGTK